MFKLAAYAFTFAVAPFLANAELVFEEVAIEPVSGIFASWPTRLVSREVDDNTGEYPFYYNEGPIHGSYCAAVRITGKIEQGDAAAFLRFITQFEARMSSELDGIDDGLPRDMSGNCFYWDYRAAGNRSEPTRLVLLDFEGGLLEEGLLLSKELEGWTTLVPRGGKCFSACAIAFLGGTYLRNSGLGAADVLATSRWLHVDGYLGFHAPQPDFRDSDTASTQDLENTYRVGFEQAEEYLARLQHETDPTVTGLVLARTGRDEFHVVNTVAEAIRFNVDVYGYRRWDQIETHQLGRLCQNVWVWHEGPGERPVGFEDTGQFLAPPDDNAVVYMGRDLITEGPDDISLDVWSYWSDGNVQTLQFHDGDGRFPEVITCRSSRRELAWNRVSGQLSVEFETKVFETSGAVHVVPEWYLQDGKFPLRAMEFVND